MGKNFLRKFITGVSSFRGGRYAGKIISLNDFCREVICGNEKVFAGQIHRRMAMDNIIPHTGVEAPAEGKRVEPTDKIKVRIIYPTGCSWNNIHTLYEAFASDDRFQAYVLVENTVRFVNIMEKVGCRYVTYDNYSLKDDRPDILVATFYSGYDKEIIFPGCEQYIKRVYGEIPNPVMNEENNEIHWGWIQRAYSVLHPDKFITDPLVYNSLLDYIDHSKLVKLSSPQFDEIYNEVGKSHPVPASWKKLEGRKVFLWATDHGINEARPHNGFTVDLYLADMLRYFSEHPEVGLIFRPHPQFIREMMGAGHFWKPEELERLKDYMKNTPNVVWDDTHDYCAAYDTCDALIVDANCSITCSFLTTGKPICRLMRYDMTEWLISPELYDCYYYAHNFEECVSYMDMIVRGEDEKADLRKEGMSKAILHFDGKNGQRIKDFVVEDFFESQK